MTSKFQANKLIQEIAPIVGGKGGGRPESAQGGGPDASKIDKALAEAKDCSLRVEHYITPTCVLMKPA